MSTTAAAAKTSEYNNIRMTTLLETVTAQRNDAQNQVANLAADKAVVEQALKDAIEANRELNQRNVELAESHLLLEQQLQDKTSALAEAHEALRAKCPEQPQTKALDEEHF